MEETKQTDVPIGSTIPVETQSKKQDIFNNVKTVSREQMLNIIEESFKMTLKTIFGEYMNVDQAYLTIVALKSFEKRLKRYVRKQK